MLVKIILILGSIGGLVASVFILVMGLTLDDWRILDDVPTFVFLIFCIIFFILNTYYVLSGNRGTVSLYFKRKKLEEEIKVQEAENRLKALQKDLKDE